MIFGASVIQFRHHIAIEGPAIGASGSQSGF